VIYFIHDPEADRIKIGHSMSLEGRLLKLKADYGRDSLRVIAVMPGGILLEKQIHRDFDHLCIIEANSQGKRYRTEWFRPSSDLIDFIDENAAPWDGRDLPDVTVEIPASEKWATWLERAAWSYNLSIPDLIEAAVAEYTHRHGILKRIRPPRISAKRDAEKIAKGADR
jgi:hypothetical protein